MNRFFFTIILVCCLCYQLYAQSTTCNCAVTIAQSGAYNNQTLRVQPGQTVCIQAGHYDNLRFSNFTGTASQPIRFKNCGGQVSVGSDASGSGVQFINSTYFALSGTGHSQYTYGFRLDKTAKSSTSGVSISGLSSDYEIERVEVAAASYAGFFMKLDPGCDSMTYQPNYTIHNVKIHDNYIHDVAGPGMFLGSGYSASSGTVITCNNVQKRVYPVQTYSLSVYNNRIETTGGTALNINNCPEYQAYNNTLIDNNLGAVPAGWQVGGSTACGCDYTITQAGAYNNKLLKVPGGKTVCIQSGHMDYLRLSNFVGSPGQRIRFINCGGQVTAGVDAFMTGIQFMGSRYFSLTGTGDPAYPYGIKLTQSNTGGGMGVSVGALSSDCEIDHVEVAKAGFAGIMVKTDPSCDSMTWRSNFAMYNVKVHDNYVHDVGGEGLYIGNSFYGSGVTVSCDGTQKQVYPHLIYGLEIYNNRIERSGAEGLQYACAPDASVHHNWMQNTGLSPFAAYQNNGLQIGGGAGGDCYSNTILNAGATGMVVVGHLGNNRIYNNVISNAGEDGIFCDDRTGSVAGTFVQFVNNTISNTGRDGIRLYNEINTNTIANNTITNYSQRASSYGYPGRPIVADQGATATRITNYTALSSSGAGYADEASNDFSLTTPSPLIDAGTSAAQWGVTTDITGLARPAGNGVDIGAYEYSLGTGSAARGRIGADLFSESTSASAFPTPCRDQVTIRLPAGHTTCKVFIYSVNGRLVRQISLNTPQHSINIATQDWPAGTYQYQLRSQTQQFQGRILKL